jgi:hypothetical protein
MIKECERLNKRMKDRSLSALNIYYLSHIRNSDKIFLLNTLLNKKYKLYLYNNR